MEEIKGKHVDLVVTIVNEVNEKGFQHIVDSYREWLKDHVITDPSIITEDDRR